MSSDCLVKRPLNMKNRPKPKHGTSLDFYSLGVTQGGLLVRPDFNKPFSLIAAFRRVLRQTLPARNLPYQRSEDDPFATLLLSVLSLCSPLNVQQG